MSRSALVTEEAVKEALQIDSFRNLSKDKIMQFASMIPNMDKDVAISIINQFPSYAESAISMVEQLKNTCDSAIEANKDSIADSIRAYKRILDDLGEVLKKDNITSEERQRKAEQMILIADKISDKDTENKEFLANVVKTGASLVGGALVLGAVILGVNVKGVNLPKLK